MNLSKVVELCKTFEGLRLKPYLCPARVPTIGYGATYYEDGSTVSLNDPPITPERAEQLLHWELTSHSAPAVRRLCPELYAQAVLDDDWDAFNAVVDFTFNLGAGRLQTSTLRRRLREGDMDSAKRELMRWVWGGGKILPGLVRRRKAEIDLL